MNKKEDKNVWNYGSYNIAHPPIGISKLLDLKEINKEISLEDNQTQEILKKTSDYC